MAFRASMAARSVDSICAASHSAASEGRSSSTSPTESSFHSPFSRTSPIFTCITFAPIVSVASRTSTGRKARLSAISAPPICASAAPPGVSQRTSGLPDAPVTSAGLPGSSSSTKRFISATRAPGVSVPKVSAFRAVRNFVNSRSFCEQAAESASRSARLGPVTALGGLLPGLELDSCARLSAPTNKVSATTERIRALTTRQFAFTSILRSPKNRRQILREGRSRHDLIAARCPGLRGQIRLHVRKKSHHPHAILAGPHPLDRLNRLAARIQIHDHQFRRALQQCQQCIAAGGHLEFQTEMLRGLRHLHLKKQIVHQRHHSAHAVPPFSSYSVEVRFIGCAESHSRRSTARNWWRRLPAGSSTCDLQKKRSNGGKYRHRIVLHAANFVAHSGCSRRNLVPAALAMRANRIIRHCTLAAFNPVVNRDLADRSQRLVVKRRHSQRRTQLFVELAQILQVLRQRRQFQPLIGQQKLLITRIPKPRELPLQHNSGQNRHLILPIGPFSEFGPTPIFFHAHNAARAANRETQRRHPLNCLRIEPFFDIPHRLSRLIKEPASVKPAASSWERRRSIRDSVSG